MNNSETKKIFIKNPLNVFKTSIFCGDVLMLGNFEGLFGNLRSYNGIPYIDGGDYEKLEEFVKFLKKGNKLFVIANESCSKYMTNLLNWLIKDGFVKPSLIKKEHYVFSTKDQSNKNYKRAISELINTGMKFDYIIQNPPYKGSLHLDFLDKGLDLLKEDGKMVIIEPATWLINVRKNGKAKKYDEIKKRIEGHVESVVIENLNKDFGTETKVPFATTTIDMSKTFGTIDLVVCGEHQTVKSIYDCNLIGDYATIWGILDKCQKYGDMMENHITKEVKGEGVWYTKYADIVAGMGCDRMCDGKLHTAIKYESPFNWLGGNLQYHFAYYSSGVSPRYNSIADSPLMAVKSGSKTGDLGDKIADNVYGTRDELENWKHFIFNNKLPLFLNIVLTIDQHNNSKPYLPWLVDRQYTDEEINQMFGFTDEEVALIDRTIKKYERNSPWFKRYMCGPDSVSDQTIMEFIKEIQ